MIPCKGVMGKNSPKQPQSPEFPLITILKDNCKVNKSNNPITTLLVVFCLKEDNKIIPKANSIATMNLATIKEDFQPTNPVFTIANSKGSTGKNLLQAEIINNGQM